MTDTEKKVIEAVKTIRDFCSNRVVYTGLCNNCIFKQTPAGCQLQHNYPYAWNELDKENNDD